MVDLEHQALGDPHRADSADARAWFSLELRAGELWAVDVQWTPDGARRLAEKTQAYISPAFLADDSGRVTSLINVALVAMPATHHAAPLVAASRGLAPSTASSNNGVPGPHSLSKNRMNPDLLKKILAAIEAGEDKSGLLAEIVAQAAGGAEPPSDVPASDALSDTAEEDPADPNKPAVLAARLSRLEAERAESVRKLSARVAELEAERAAEDQAERVALCGQLVRLGAETPATAWDGAPDLLRPSRRLQGIAIGDLREHVRALSARGPLSNAAPPASAEVEYTPSEIEAMTTMNEAQKAKFKAIRASRRAK